MFSLSSPSGTLGNLTGSHQMSTEAPLRTSTPFNSVHSVHSVQPLQLASRNRMPQTTTRSSSTNSALSQEDPGYTKGARGTLPGELSNLSDLVGQLERAGVNTDLEVSQLKRAVVGLADDVKKQISTVRASPTPKPKTPQLSNIPGRSRLTPSTDGEMFRAESGLSDLEGLFPRSHAAQGTDDGGRTAEPGIPRSEVIAMRSRLNKKLSESNTYNRFLLREIQYREDAIRDTKALLVALLSELKEVSSSIAELSSVQSFLPMNSIGPDCMPSLVKIKLEGLLDDLEKQLQGVEAMKLRDVPLVWFGMAEDVKVMGSFDGWTYGEQMSPESTGTMTRFATTLKLRPGTYEIKFMVDGEWRIAPEWPTSGHGMTENNVLVVD